jgi:hypothetical protein
LAKVPTAEEGSLSLKPVLYNIVDLNMSWVAVHTLELSTRNWKNNLLLESLGRQRHIFSGGKMMLGSTRALNQTNTGLNSSSAHYLQHPMDRSCNL